MFFNVRFQRSKIQEYCSEERGAIFAWMVFLLPLFIMLAGLVVDLSTMYVLVNRVQTTMDAAGTSAVTFSLKEESLRNDSQLRLDEDVARERFLWYICKNLSLTPDLFPKEDSVIEGRISILNLDIAETPPSLEVTLEVPFKTCIMRYLVKDVKVPISAEYVVDRK